MTRALLAALLLSFVPVACVAPASHGADAGLFDAAGYRTSRFRTPVDRRPNPAHTIDLDAALRLVPGRNAVFVDVLPVDGGWRDPATGVWRLGNPHESVPGALWHPETGRGVVDKALWQGLLDAVARERADMPDAPVVVFCRADCWMGWNAARRLARAGVGKVFWLAEGIDGWHARGRRLVPADPATIPPRP